jgi:hypothetical protein
MVLKFLSVRKFPFGVVTPSSTDRQPGFRVEGNALEVRDFFDIDQAFGGNPVIMHVYEQVSAAGENGGFAVALLQQCIKVFKGFRSLITEVLKHPFLLENDKTMYLVNEQV